MFKMTKNKILNFGKYKGKTLLEIREINDQYFLWYCGLSNVECDEELKNMASKITRRIRETAGGSQFEQYDEDGKSYDPYNAGYFD